MLLLSFLFSATAFAQLPSVLDNGVNGLPEVDCMEDRVKLTFNTAKAFRGRIYVKGMVDKKECVQNFDSNRGTSVQFELQNGACNMRRQRMIEPDKRGMEESITIIISFHHTFITKVDKAFRCTCFYMEADKVVTSRFDVSMLPTTDLIDTARMPLCTYSVRRDSIDGAIVQFAAVGETVYHVWQCESDMFSMLVHSCFVDDGNGQDRKPILDEYGCTIDDIIVPDLTYNQRNNLAYAPVSVTTYFQCAVSTCMLADGMCEGKTPPACGARRNTARLVRRSLSVDSNETDMWYKDSNTMDLAAQKITVLDLEERTNDEDALHLAVPVLEVSSRTAVCISPHITAFLTAIVIFSLLLCGVLAYFVFSKKGKNINLSHH